jgi:hypothetical protein
VSNTDKDNPQDPQTSELIGSEDDEESAEDDEKIDEAGRESFPASDPPAY